MEFTLIGDIHQEKRFFNSKFLPENSIQIGDLGFEYDEWIRNNRYRTDNWKTRKRFFISGNHEKFSELKEDNDSIYMLRTGLYHIPRFFLSGTTLFIGGADSIDKKYRIEGRDWFKEESISFGQFNNAMNKLEGKNVDTVIAHDLPSLYYPQVDIFDSTGGHAKALSEIFLHFQPKRWFCGHHHKTRNFIEKSCEFRVLNIGEKINVKLDINEKDFFE